MNTSSEETNSSNYWTSVLCEKYGQFSNVLHFDFQINHNKYSFQIKVIITNNIEINNMFHNLQGHDLKPIIVYLLIITC
jgi:hypothetical protein